MNKNFTNKKKAPFVKWQVVFSALVLLIFTSGAMAQTTVSTTGTVGWLNNNGSGTATFNVQNTNAFPITITTVEGLSGTAGLTSADIWYKITPVNGPPGAISVANGWVLGATGTYTAVVNTTTLVTQVILSGISVVIPAGATYGVAVSSYSGATGRQRYFTMTAGFLPTTTVTAGGVNIIMGTLISYAGFAPPTAPTNHPRGWIGKLTFTGSGGPCINPITPGTSTAIPSSGICVGTALALNITGATSGTGQTYQWQSCPTIAGTYTNIGSLQTVPGLNTTTTATLYYRCEMICSAGTPAYSTPVLVTINPPFPGGIYTINSAIATGGGNYQTFAAAAAALNCGISGPVVFNVDAASGPYTEQVEIGPIGGASAINTITFNGNGRGLTFAASVSTAPGTLILNGADFITVNNLAIEGTGATYALACHLWNGADNNTFNNCTFTVPANNTAATQVPFSISGSATSATAAGTGGNNNTISGCTMNSGYYNTTLISGTNNQVIGCSILDFYFYGVYSSAQVSSIISGNTIERPTRTVTSTFYGVYVVGASTNMLVEKNRIRKPFDGNPASTSIAYGIYSSIDGTLGNENRYYNNLISDMNGNGTMGGIYLTGADFVKVYHNTVSLDFTGATAGTTYGIYSTGTVGGIDIQNNIVSIARGGTGIKYCLYYTGVLQTSNYNNLFINAVGGTNNIAYNGTAYTTLGAWQTASLKDANSNSTNPVYVSPGTGNYRPNTLILDNTATPLGITTDIINASRSLTTPDPGAYEFTISAGLDIGAFSLVTPATTGCYSDLQTIVIRVKNYGGAIDFSTDPVAVTCNVTGTAVATLTGGLTVGTLGINQTVDIPLTGTFDMSVNGSYSFDAFTTCASDGLATNDAMVTETRTRAAILAGTVASNQTDFCLSGAPILTLSGSANGAIQWQSSTISNVGPWTNVGTGTTTYAPGTISTTTHYQAVTSCILASLPSNAVTVNVNNPSILTTNSPQNLCGSGSVNFTATGTGATTNWYTAASGGSPIATGGSYSTPTISTTTDYWVASSSGGGSSNVGAASPSIGTTSTTTLTNHFMLFNVLASSLTINTVTIYPTAAIGSSYNIVIQNAATTQIFSTGAFTNTVTGGTTPQIVTLNATIPAGTGYRMGVITNAGMIRNTTGAVYPYTVPAYVTITGNTFDVNYWYYFYDWSISTGCESPRTMVTANVTTAPAIVPGTTLATVCSGGATNLTVSSSNPDYTYTWMPGSLTGTSVAVTPATTQIYTVTALDNTAGPFAGCTQISTVTITAQPTSATIAASPDGFCVSGGTATLSLTPSSGYPANTIQWQDSPNNTVFTDILGATSTSVITTISASTYYKALIKDGNNVVCIEPSYYLLINNPQVLTTLPGSTVGTGTVSLEATGTGTTINWYTAASGGNSIGTGSPFITPVISSTTDYYVATASGSGGTQTTTMPAQSATFAGNVRGYWFTAPAAFTMTGLNVPLVGSGQSIAVVKFTGNIPPPTFSVVTNAFTTLFLTQNNLSTGFIPCNISIAAGEVIGLFGQVGAGASALTSYGPATNPINVSIAGSAVPLTRMIMQFPLSTTVPQNISQEISATTQIGRVDFQYNTGCESARTLVTATFIPPALDASIALNAPAPPAAVAGMNAVSVNITNLSISTTITDLSLSYTDGITTNTESFTGLNIAVGTSQIVTFLTPYNVVGTFNFSASIITVNGVTDASAANNTTTPVSICVGLNGTYTINSGAATGGSNFNNLVDVGVALSCGIAGPVVFNMLSSFTDQVTILPINGASAINTITFNGNGNSLSYAATLSTAPHTLALNGADYLRFNDLTINGTGVTYALVCHLWNDADNNMFTNCTFNAPANGTSTTMVPFSISGTAISGTAAGLSGNNNIITGCTMFSGYYNTTMVGASGTPNTGNQIINCNIRDQYLYATYMLYQNGAIVRGNVLERPTRTTLSTYYGIYVATGCTNMLVEKNRIRNTWATVPTSTGTQYSIYCTIDASVGNENLFYNNLISDINFNGTIYGMYMSGSDYWKAYHNTISLDQTASTATSTTYGIYCTGSLAYDVRNNIVSIKRGGTATKYCVYYSVPAAATSNNNNLYINAAAGTNNLGYNGTAYTTLAAWQGATSFDAASQSADPLFVNPAIGDYTPTALAFNGIGATLGITDDINNLARNLVGPDPGAFEFANATTIPLCATVSSNNTACITGTSLSWPIAPGFPSGYKISYGLTPAANDLVFQQDIGNSLSFAFTPLQIATQYYYLVEPYNTFGDAIGCTIGSFMSGASVTQTPTQSPASYTETIDNGVVPPALPCGMTSSNENFPQDAFTWYTSSTAPQAGIRHLRIDKNTNNTTAKDDWFYSAPMNLTAGKLYRIYFWHRVSIAGSENFEVFLSNGADAATMLTTSAIFNGSSNLLTYKLDSTADIIPLTSGVYYYGFHANGAANGRSLYMDEIQVRQVPVSALDPASCTTIPSLYDQLLVQSVFGAQDYKFKIENLANSFSYEYTRNLAIPDFRLKWAPGVVYDLTYDVSVSYKKNNVWSPYGASCPVTMGPFPMTQLRGASCGAVLTDQITQLYIDSVGGANDYEYRIVQNTLAYDHTWMRGAPVLDYRLYWAYQYAPSLVERIPFGFTYDVQVRALVGRTGPAQGNLPGVFGTFGPVCTVTLAGQPQTQLQPTSCGITLTSITDQIFCIPVTGAGNYRYHVVNVALGYDVLAYRNSPLNDYRLSWLPTVGGIGLRYSTTYNITVSDYVGGVWSTEGNLCQVTTPASPLTQLQVAYCPYTLPTFSTTVYCDAVPAATNYRYHITGPASFDRTVMRNSPGTDFKFSWSLVCCGGQNMLPNTTYQVEVASYAGGVWSAYGTVCSVTTGASVPRYSPFLAEEGMNESSASLSLSVYPNPAAVSEEYSIELTGIQTANATIELDIYNMLGEKVYRSVVITKEESRMILKPEQVLATGVYMVEARFAGNVYREKFVVK